LLAAGWALIDEKAAVEGASRHKAKVPNCPPNGLLPQTARTDSGASIIELVATHRLATERPLCESPGSFHWPVGHREPFLWLETQYMGEGADMILRVECGGRP
jgi:hypothetical protein